MRTSDRLKAFPVWPSAPHFYLPPRSRCIVRRNRSLQCSSAIRSGAMKRSKAPALTSSLCGFFQRHSDVYDISLPGCSGALGNRSIDSFPASASHRGSSQYSNWSFCPSIEDKLGIAGIVRRLDGVTAVVGGHTQRRFLLGIRFPAVALIPIATVFCIPLLSSSSHQNSKKVHRLSRAVCSRAVSPQKKAGLSRAPR